MLLSLIKSNQILIDYGMLISKARQIKKASRLFYIFYILFIYFIIYIFIIFIYYFIYLFIFNINILFSYLVENIIQNCFKVCEECAIC